MELESRTGKLERNSRGRSTCGKVKSKKEKVNKKGRKLWPRAGRMNIAKIKKKNAKIKMEGCYEKKQDISRN
jgi:hypothetical protein